MVDCIEPTLNCWNSFSTLPCKVRSSGTEPKKLKIKASQKIRKNACTEETRNKGFKERNSKIT